MTQMTLFTLGMPFGHWPSVAKSFLDEHMLDPAVARWHQDVVGAPLPEVNGTNVLDALLGIEIAPGMAERLQAMRPARALRWGGADVRLNWTGHAVAERLPEAKFLVWVEHPASLLAHWLPAARGTDPAAALAFIESSVQGVLNLVQRHRARCLVVYADEALAHPDALIHRLKEWLGPNRGESALPAPRAHQPLDLLLSEQLVASRPRLLRDYERLYASCLPLDESDEAPAMRSATLALEAIKAQVRSREELAKAQRDSEFMLVQLHQTQEALEQVAGEFETLRRESGRKAASNAGDGAHSGLGPATQGAELLLVQLHQVQEELEHYYQAYRDLETGQGGATAQPIAGRTTRVEIGVDRDTPPHRELNLVLYGLVSEDKKLDRLHVRLVEHRGHAGLVLLQPHGTPAPLSAWDPSGSEDDLLFVLLIPGDDHGLQRLQRMGTSDWLVVESVVRSIERALNEGSAGTQASRWGNVARRLAQQLAELPARFRFDRVDAVPDPQAAGALVATFRNVSFGSRQAAQLPIRWWPRAEQAGSASVELLCPAGGQVPLPASWPVDAAGAWQAAWPLPLAGASRAELSAAWRSMSRAEREFLFGLLDALPAAAAATARQQSGTTTGHTDELVAAAARPLQTAFRLFHGTRMRRVVQAARGHLRA